MKKLILLPLLCATLVACGSGQSGSTSTDSTATDSTATAGGGSHHRVRGLERASDAPTTELHEKESHRHHALP
nr:hypothetical protein [uncultured Porphyromonas sp.]